MTATRQGLALVTGAGGFIGGHLVRHLKELGWSDVRAVDFKPKSEWYQRHSGVDERVLDLREAAACREAAAGATQVYNLAADMGGMGFIETHKAECMLSVLINTHMLMAAKDAGAKRFFFSSSACVYNADKQTSADVTALREEDAYPAMPEDGYGWEKLFSERMCRHFREDFGLITRTARYHNVYGQWGTYDGGREKAPAAICRKVIEANGGEVVFEEYYPLDQAEYSATIGKIRDGKVDCVFNTVIPPGLQPFVKQLYESGFQKNGGVLSCVYYDENLLNYHPAQEMDGLYSCLDYFQSVDDPFSKQLQADYAKRFPDTKYLFTAGSASTGMYRGIKLYEASVKATNGDLARDAVSAAMDKAKIAQGPGGGAEMVPGKMHCRMNMYIAQCKVDAGKTRYAVIESDKMVDPKEC